MIVLNPKSGPGKSREIFENEVKPVLMEADIPYDLYITRARNDARYKFFLNFFFSNKIELLGAAGGRGEIAYNLGTRIFFPFF